MLSLQFLLAVFTLDTKHHTLRTNLTCLGEPGLSRKPANEKENKDDKYTEKYV